MRPTLFLRIAAVSTFIHAALHTIGGVFGKPSPGPSHSCRRGDENESVSADGTHAELLGFLPRTRVGGYRIPHGRGGPLLATGVAGKDGRASAAADSVYVFVCIYRDGGELERLLLCRAGDCGRSSSRRASDWRSLPLSLKQ